MTDTNYNADSIEILIDLEPVKMRPGMYTETDRPNHLAQEVIDNCVDEALAGHANLIQVVAHSDGGMTVTDTGRGMPVDIHPETGRPAIEAIFTKLHAGGKFDGNAYGFSGGLHGVGISVVNALSTHVKATVSRNYELSEIEFEDGFISKPLFKYDRKAKLKSGTKVYFKPDPKYFDSPNFDLKSLKRILQTKAILCKGLRVVFHDEKSGEKIQWKYDDGLHDYVSSQLNEYETVMSDLYMADIKTEDCEVEVAFNWMVEPVSAVVSNSYVNLIPTPQHGTHVNGLRQGILDAVAEYCNLHNLLPKKMKLTSEDVWQGLNFLLSLKMREAQFSGQTKERLSSRTASGMVQVAVRDAFSLWLNKNTEEAAKVAEKVIENAGKRIRSAQKVIRKKITQGPALPGKLSDCGSTDLAETELFLVEGDSAGGSAKQARDKVTQAILPLRGKIKNTWEDHTDQVLSSNEIHDIAVAMGVDPGSEDMSGLRYGKLCILADADSDGYHIATLLCALFVQHFKALVKNGHIFVALPPLFRIDHGKTVYYALDESERDGILRKIEASGKRGNVVVSRFKGLGEMNPEQLRETTMNVNTRRLVQLTLPDETEEQAINLIDCLLHKKKAAWRKEWISGKQKPEAALV